MSICPCPYVHFGTHFILFLFVYSENKLNFAAEIEKELSMTAVAKKLLETPMAPYSSLLQGMSREEKKIKKTWIEKSANLIC